MIPELRIKVEEFDALSAQAPRFGRPHRIAKRNWSRILGLIGTFALHGLAIQFVAFGSTLQKPKPPTLQGAGATMVKATPAEELVLVTVANAPKRDSDLMGQLASFTSHLRNLPILMSVPDSLPTLEVANIDEEASQSTQNTPEAGDPAVRALMFGRYTGQISARIERAWIRPRAPVSDAASTATSSSTEDRGAVEESDTFTCRVQIRQGAHGDVQGVLLLDCNGSEAWRHSLVVAIDQASPLPAPPTRSVFTRALNMTFQAHVYRPGGSQGEYQYEAPPTALVNDHGARPGGANTP